MGKYLEKSKHDVFVNRFLLRIKVELLPSMQPKKISKILEEIENISKMYTV